MLPAVLHRLLLPLLQLYTSQPIVNHSNPSISFQLRHAHGIANSTNVFADVSPSLASESFTINTRPLRTHKLRSYDAYTRARWRSRAEGVSEIVDWDAEIVPGPDVENRETLLTLAKMTYNAYIEEGDADWYDLGPNWGNQYPFGFEPDADGFRGHVFISNDNKTVIASIKGTSAGLFGRGGPTARKDKLNDNLLFSCCCARVDWTWTPVCGCYGGGWKCDEDCVQQSLVDDSLFYPIGTNLYNNLTYLYPDANIWVIGHSLGGALASLIGVTFGAPVVAFEAPGERMAARRLHLPSPPSTQHITHIYHTADPIPMGACNGALSACAIGGYAMESRCHLGKSAVYNTVEKLGWSVDLRTHPIKVIIDRLLQEDWEPPSDGNPGRQVPHAEPEDEDCDECYSWEYGQYKNSTEESMLELPLHPNRLL